MSKEMQLKNCFTYTVFGDALGFVKENRTNRDKLFSPFQFEREKDLTLSMEAGQWSDLTELSLIMIKCLLDQPKRARVSVDYKRLREELRLWRYYRHGRSENLLKKIEGRKAYYQLPQYWEDKGGYGFSRIIVLFLANKNLEAAKEEAFKQIIYTNRHPQVIITGLLLMRTLYLLLDQRLLLEALVEELKAFLIELQGKDFEVLVNQSLPPKYTIQFEREKINYLMALDRLKNTKEVGLDKFENCRDIFLGALLKYQQLMTGLSFNEDNKYPKEALAIAHGLWGLSNPLEAPPLAQLKNWEFINTMGDYLIKLRNYEINRSTFVDQEKEIELFQLKEGTVFRHPILNVTKVTKRGETQGWLQLELATKGIVYTLYKRK